MPWKECHVMDERLRLVARLLEGEKMAPLCAEFGISRKTGYLGVPEEQNALAHPDRYRIPALVHDAGCGMAERQKQVARFVRDYLTERSTFAHASSRYASVTCSAIG